MDKLFKQTSWVFVAQVISRGIGFVYTIYLARSLGVDDFGKFSVALVFFSLISAVADFGFNRYLIREVANDHLKASKLLANIAIFRLTVACVLFAIFAVILYEIDPDKSRVSMILLAVMAVIPMGVSQTVDAVFVGVQKLHFSAVATIVLAVATAGFGVYLINEGFGPTGAITALILGQIIYLLIQVRLLYRGNISLVGRIDRKTIKDVVISSLPYGLLGILGLLYFRIDTLMLTYMRGNYDVGIYTAAYKFVEAVIFIPSALAVALFPMMAKLHQEDVSQLKSIYFKTVRIMALISFVVVVGYFFVLPMIIEKYLPLYMPAIEVIKILSFTIPFMFIHAPGVQVLLSTDKYLKQVVLLSFLTVGFNIGANFIFIPLYGYIGAAWVTVVSEMLSFIIFFTVINKKVFKSE